MSRSGSSSSRPRAHGKPVLASQNGGPTEYVRHQVNGLKIHAGPDRFLGSGPHVLRSRPGSVDGRKWPEGCTGTLHLDTITERMLTIYLGLCPSPAMLPRRAADSVPAVLAESSRETTWAGIIEESCIAVIDEARTRSPHISVQARLHFRTADPDGEPDDALAACKSSLARSGLNPQRQDHTLTIKGDWETVLAALNRCRRHIQRIRAHHDQLPDIETTAISGQLRQTISCSLPLDVPIAPAARIPLRERAPETTGIHELAHPIVLFLQFPSVLADTRQKMPREQP